MGWVLFGHSKGLLLYLFGGGYILLPDPGDIILCGQIAENCDAEVWFPLYPMADHPRNGKYPDEYSW